jgi:hypothetical protein
MAVKMHILDDRVLAFAEKSLSRGILPGLFWKRINSAPGEWFVYVDSEAGFTTDDLSNFGMSPKPWKRFEDAGFRFISDLVSKQSNGLLLAYDIMSSPNDEWLKQVNVPWLTCEDEVNFFLCGQEITPPQISEFISYAQTADPAFSAIVSILPLEYSWPCSETGIVIERPLLEAAASNAVACIMKAYDGDGYIYWKASQ